MKGIDAERAALGLGHGVQLLGLGLRSGVQAAGLGVSLAGALAGTGTSLLQAARLLAGDFGITLKVEDQAPQQLLWLQNAEKLFGDGAQPTDDDGILLPPDGE